MIHEDENVSLFVQSRLTASVVGSLVGLKSDEMKQVASEYTNKV